MGKRGYERWEKVGIGERWKGIRKVGMGDRRGGEGEEKMMVVIDGNDGGCEVRGRADDIYEIY